MTFEESFIAFKVGLGYIARLSEKLSAAESFFSLPLSTETILSLVRAFSDVDQDFRVLLMHLPPPEMATVLSSNNRASLQTSTWNAFIALWSFQEVFGRLTVSLFPRDFRSFVS